MLHQSPAAPQPVRAVAPLVSRPMPAPAPVRTARPAVPPVEEDGDRWLAAGAWLFALAAIAMMVAGFVLRSRDLFVPGEGVGYYLGITGGVSMLLLLAYPLVKRIAFLGFQKHSGFWLRAHMVLGTLGPLLIFYHSNFSWGATNSNVALLSMMVVALSGVVGRYIYTRLHRHMSAAKLDLNTLLANSARLMAIVSEDTGGGSPGIATAMADFAAVTFAERHGVLANLAEAALMPWQTWRSRLLMRSEVRRAVQHHGTLAGWTRSERRQRLRSAHHHVDEFLHYVGRASQLSFWERMFSWWHVFHVPLFFVLFVSGVVHVVAVHLY